MTKKQIILLLLLTVHVTVRSQNVDTIIHHPVYPSRAVSSDSVQFVPFYDPGPSFLTPNQLLLGVDDSIIRLEYKRGKCLVVVTNDSTGVIKGVYLSKIKYSHGSLKERRRGYYCQFDEQGQLVSITEYGRHKKKYQYDLNWDSEKKRYY